jgi:hypothetical protein
MSRTRSAQQPRSALPGICSACRAAPALIAIEANGLAGGFTLCGDCFGDRVAEQRARRVTPMGGVPLAPTPVIR